MSGASRAWRRLRQAIAEAAGRTYAVDGCRLTLPAWADDVKRNIRRGVYEAPERRLVRSMISGDRPVVELGGAFGVVSAVIGSRLSPDIMQVVVEADARLADLCRINAGSARAPDARLAMVNAAIAYTGATVRFRPSDAFLGSRVALPGEAEGPEVPATTLAQVLSEHLPQGEFDLVCDIEGSEHELFTYDAAALSRCRVALVEIHADLLAARGSSETAFLARAGELGFEVVARDENVVGFRRVSSLES